MKRHLSILTTFTAALLTTSAVFAEQVEERQDPAIGEPAPQFVLNDVVTGEPISLADHQGKVVVIAFQSINCPWNVMRESGGYERYLAPLSQQFDEEEAVFLAINSNHNESAEELASYHEEHGLPYPILKDPDNLIADVYNAQTTPHIYVVAADEAQTLVYIGGIEQIPTSPEKAGEMEENYIEPVLAALFAGEELPYTKTTSKGCSIKRVPKAQ